MIPEWQGRVHQERDDLEANMAKLKTYIDSIDRKTLTGAAYEHHGLLMRQLADMRVYAETLNARIALFSQMR